MSVDYYAEIRLLENDLWDAGLKQWAEKLQEEMSAGATASEILMGVRWTLTQMLAQEPSLPADKATRALSLKEALDKLLA